MFRKIAALYLRVRRDAHILWHALRHPARPVWLLPAVGLIGLYLLSPIDLIPRPELFARARRKNLQIGHKRQNRSSKSLFFQKN